MMKINMQFIALALLFLNVNGASAQDRSYEGTISIEPVRLEQSGEFLHIDLDVIMDDVKVKSARGVDFIPQLISSTTTRDLPRISIKGRNEYLAYERRLSVMSRKQKDSYRLPYLVEKNYKKKSGVLQYRYALPYEPWMADARLNVQRDECGCGESTLMNVEYAFDKVTLERMLVPYVVTPYLSYVEPMVEEIKSRDVQAECFLDFVVNRVDIRPEYMNNPQELAKLRAMIDELKADADIQVKSLDIIGYASPEGTLAANKRLSEGRAMALRDYLACRYDFPRNQYYIVFGGENWDGLEKALETIELEYKDEVLDIIRNIPIEKGRETKLMQLHGGTPYRYLLKYIFPSLRVAICKVNYEVRDFSVEEAKEIIKTRPQNLSLNEMFLVANTYPTGSQEFIDVFETAVQMYPQSEIANINAATAALSRNELVSAERYLDMVNSNKNLPEYNNAMGILMLMKGDYESSKKYLKFAEQSGLDAARSNLEELVRKKANAAKMKKNGK